VEEATNEHSVSYLAVATTDGSDFLRLQKILLVVQTDHDGRIGAAEFEKAAKELSAMTPQRFELNGSAGNLGSCGQLLQTNAPEAIVFWTDTPTADELLPRIQKIRPMIPVFLCRKAAEFGAAETFSGESFAVDSAGAGQAAAASKFRELHRARTGANSGIAANEIYLAVPIRRATTCASPPSSNCKPTTTLSPELPIAANDGIR
jgi:hypothetical protein